MKNIFQALWLLTNMELSAQFQGDTLYSNSTKILKSDEIPAPVFQNTKLKHIYIGGMDCDFVKIDDKGNIVKNCWMIRNIPKEISNLQKLETLRLPQNAISELPKEFSTLKSLKKLDLTDNPGLGNIEAICSLTDLEELMLFGCNLEHLPFKITQLKKLKYIGLTGNNIPKSEIEEVKRYLPKCVFIYDK